MRKWRFRRAWWFVGKWQSRDGFELPSVWPLRLCSSLPSSTATGRPGQRGLGLLGWRLDMERKESPVLVGREDGVR